jgi:hypothetical protein
MYPQTFKQLYVIMGFYKGKFIPLVCVLMKNKTEQDYAAILDRLEFSPNLEYAYLDFERAGINSLETMFRQLHLYAKVVFFVVQKII